MINIMSDITFTTYVKVSQPKPPEERDELVSLSFLLENIRVCRHLDNL